MRMVVGALLGALLLPAGAAVVNADSGATTISDDDFEPTEVIGLALDVSPDLIHETGSVFFVDGEYVSEVGDVVVSIDPDPSSPIEWQLGPSEIGVELPAVPALSPGVRRGDGTVEYLAQSGDFSIVVNPTVTGGVQILVGIQGETAPTRFDFRVVGDFASSMTVQEDGSVDIGHASSSVMARVQAPWAFDANGAEVPVRYLVSNESDILSLEVDHHGSVYPVVADPDFGFFGVCDSWDKAAHEIDTYTRTVRVSGTPAYSLTSRLLCGEPGPKMYGWRHITNSSRGQDHPEELRNALKTVFGSGPSDRHFVQLIETTVRTGRAEHVGGNQVRFSHTHFFHNPSGALCRSALIYVFVQRGTGIIKTAFAANAPTIIKPC